MKNKENLVIHALDERWTKYRLELKACQKEFSAEVVHDLRVATRRLLAVMEILRTLDPHPRVTKIRRALKEQLDSLDALRDTQVMLGKVSELAADFAELKPFQEHLLKREKKLLRRAGKEIGSLRISKLKRRIEKCHLALEETARARGWTAQLLLAVDQAYARARQAFGQIEAAQSTSIHRFRVAFKKFRYMVEIVNPVLKGYPEAYFKQMHAYQSRMGDVQDAEVILGALTEFALFESVLKVFENQRAELIETFLHAKDEFHLFWRESPKGKFPWESQHETVHRSSRHRRGGGHARVRGRQPAPIDRQGQKEDAKNRAGVERDGGGG